MNRFMIHSIVTLVLAIMPLAYASEKNKPAGAGKQSSLIAQRKAALQQATNNTTQTDAETQRQAELKGLRAGSNVREMAAHTSMITPTAVLPDAVRSGVQPQKGDIFAQKLRPNGQRRKNCHVRFSADNQAFNSGAVDFENNQQAPAAQHAPQASTSWWFWSSTPRKMATIAAVAVLVGGLFWFAKK